MSTTVSLELSDEVYVVLQRKAALEFLVTDPSTVAMMIKRMLILDITTSSGDNVDLDQLASATVREQNAPPLPVTKTSLIVKDSEEVAVNVTETTKIVKLELPRKEFHSKPNGQWVILSAIVESAFQREAWESFTVKDIAFKAKMKENTTASALKTLMRTNWLSERTAPGSMQKIYALTRNATEWIKANQTLLMDESMITSAGHPPRDEYE